MGKGAATMVAGSRASGAAALVSHLWRARAAAARPAAVGHGRRVGAMGIFKYLPPLRLAPTNLPALEYEL